MCYTNCGNQELDFKDNFFKKGNLGTESDPSTVEKVKEIMLLFGHTVSAMKLFPSHHSTVQKFVDELYEKLKVFLEEHWKLELNIEEFTFTSEGEPVYTDTHPGKSLPFFFFKDGMQILFFYRDLEKKELWEFLELVKREALFPPEESDIVNALWERDFANIRYFAPDEFLESRIGVGKPPIEIQVDREKMTTGRLVLTPDDKEALMKKDSSSNLLAEIGTEEKLEEITDEEKISRIPNLNEEELAAIDLMIQSNRQISSEEELINLTLEILDLEERPDLFEATLNLLEQQFQDIVQKGNIALAYLLLARLSELARQVRIQSPEKLKLLEKFFERAETQTNFEELKGRVLAGEIKDIELLFSFFRLLGEKACFLVAELYEELKSEEFRSHAMDFFAEFGQKNLSLLANLGHKNRPALTREIIYLLSRNGKKALPYFAPFVNFEDRSIKEEAIKAMGKIPDPMANKILLGFLADGDEQIRIQSLLNLHHIEDNSTISHILKWVAQKEFLRKSGEEKAAALKFLAKTQNEEAYTYFLKLFRKLPSWLSSLFSTRSLETGLCAVSALEKIGTPKAMEILQEGIKARNKKIKNACLQALEKIASSQREEKENPDA